VGGFSEDKAGHYCCQIETWNKIETVGAVTCLLVEVDCQRVCVEVYFADG
jgi:hypothetical protein